MTSRLYWGRLPPELQLLVLELVAGPDPQPDREPRYGSGRETLETQETEDTEDTEETGAHAYVWAPYAAVSREWQAFFEQRTFASLALFNDDVEPFCTSIKRRAARLACVGRLRLTIDLPTYTCKECNKDENAATMKRNNRVFTDVLWRLLYGLAVPVPAAHTQGTLQLELGVRSVSDGQHALRDCRIRNPFVTMSSRRKLWKYIYGDRTGIRYQPPSCSKVGRWDFNRLIPVPAASRRRILGTRPLVLDFDGDRHLRHQMHRDPPVAAVVQTLVQSRRFYRTVQPDTLSYLLQNCLPGVQQLRLEPWWPVDAASLGRLEHGYGRLLANLARSAPSLRELHIFLENSCRFHRDHDRFGVNPTPMGKDYQQFRERSQLARRLAEGSNHLEHLELINMAFFVEADAFFTAVARLPTTITTTATETETIKKTPHTMWPKLTTLIITSSTLSPKSSLEDIERLLLAAADVTERMPELRAMEIWNVVRKGSCRFTVTAIREESGQSGQSGQPPEARLRLSATWPCFSALSDNVLCAWESVTQKWLKKTHPWTDEEGRLVVERELLELATKWQMDARVGVLESKSLIGANMLKQSFQDMQAERCRLWLTQ